MQPAHYTQGPVHCVDAMLSAFGQWVRGLNNTLLNPIEDSFTARRTLGVREQGSLTWRTPAGARPATRPYGARGPPIT